MIQEELIDKIQSVEVRTMHTDVTFWRPKIGSSIHRKKNEFGDNATPATTPVTTPGRKRNEGKEIREKIYRIIKSSPTLSKAEIAELCGLKKEGVRYHIEKLRNDKGLHWEGNSLNGQWRWREE